ncbi:hypothetical protein CSUI_001426 [Cystoisospora suis]|uniref:Uncharacterized protein n=1 Tax=Cystoisospora suis TaxID=483139 RepID=A0A2C6L8P5_9APIC|nr:hypothetical protein CSUI_001426 [Cystoisospora suis]
MSYGWLTESSLLPKRAVRIGGVSDSSLFNLSSQIYCLQQEQHQRPLQPLHPVQQQIVLRHSRPEAVSLTYTGAQSKIPISGRNNGAEVRRNRGASESEKGTAGAEETKDDSRVGSGVDKADGETKPRRIWQEEVHALDRQARLMEGKNARVEERAAADEEFYAANLRTVEAGRRKLEQKAKLYEAVMSGRMDALAAPGGTRQLIDFEEKLWRTPASVSMWSVSPEARKSSGDARNTARLAARHQMSPEAEEHEGVPLSRRPVAGGDQSTREGSNVSVEPEGSARFSNDMESMGSEWRMRGPYRQGVEVQKSFRRAAGMKRPG